MKTFFICTLFLLVSTISCAESPFIEIQKSHIESNVPSPDVFDKILKRDLFEYFHKSIGKTVKTVRYRLLRDGPTQSGVAYPKYYLWVIVKTDFKKIAEGAVRAAAIERKRFEVTHFLSKEEIQKNPDQVNSIFPKPLVPSILSTAGVQ